MAILSKEEAIKKIFPQSCKTFYIFILSMYILFCRKNQKNVLQMEIKDRNFEVYLLAEELSSWSCWLNHGKWPVPDPMGGSWIFYLMVGLWILFLRLNVLPKLGKIAVTCPKSRKGSILTCPKSAMNMTFELLKVNKMTSLKIRISSVTEKLEKSNLDSSKPHLKGFIWYSTSGGSVSLAHKHARG